MSLLGKSQLCTEYIFAFWHEIGESPRATSSNKKQKGPIMAFQEAMAALKLIFFFFFFLSDEVPNWALWMVVDPPSPKARKIPEYGVILVTSTEYVQSAVFAYSVHTHYQSNQSNQSVPIKFQSMDQCSPVSRTVKK